MGTPSGSGRGGLRPRAVARGAASAAVLAVAVAVLVGLPAWADEVVTPAQLAETNRELDTARSTATISLVVAVVALLLAAIALVAARTGRSRR